MCGCCAESMDRTNDGGWCLLLLRATQYTCHIASFTWRIFIPHICAFTLNIYNFMRHISIWNAHIVTHMANHMHLVCEYKKFSRSVIVEYNAFSELFRFAMCMLLLEGANLRIIIKNWSESISSSWHAHLLCSKIELNSPAGNYSKSQLMFARKMRKTYEDWNFLSPLLHSLPLFYVFFYVLN